MYHRIIGWDPLLYLCLWFHHLLLNPCHSPTLVILSEEIAENMTSGEGWHLATWTAKAQLSYQPILLPHSPTHSETGSNSQLGVVIRLKHRHVIAAGGERRRYTNIEVNERDFFIVSGPHTVHTNIRIQVRTKLSFNPDPEGKNVNKENSNKFLMHLLLMLWPVLRSRSVFEWLRLQVFFFAGSDSGSSSNKKYR